MKKCATVVVLCDFVEEEEVSRQSIHSLRYRHFKRPASLPSFNEMINVAAFPFDHRYVLQEMCSMFWPLTTSEPKTFGNIKVCFDDKTEQDSYNEYHLTVSFTVRTSYKYTAWARAHHTHTHTYMPTSASP